MRVLAALTLLCLAGSAHAGMHKCMDADGRIHYQDSSCGANKTPVNFNSSAASGATTKGSAPMRGQFSPTRVRALQKGFLSR